MHWILERDMWPEYEANMLAACRAFGNATLVEFESDGRIVGRPPRVCGPVVAYGSKVVQKAIAHYRWRPGGWFGAGFDVASYAEGLGDLYVNAGFRLVRASNVGEQPEPRLFLRPLDDDKLFAGDLFDTKEFSCWLARQRDIGYLPMEDFDLAAAAPTQLGAEHRIIIANGKAVAGCRYKPDQAPDFPRAAARCAEDAASLYAPAPVFVVDVAETDAGRQVVEYNAFNSADLYRCDRHTVVAAVAQIVGAAGEI